MEHTLNGNVSYQYNSLVMKKH